MVRLFLAFLSIPYLILCSGVTFAPKNEEEKQILKLFLKDALLKHLMAFQMKRSTSENKSMLVSELSNRNIIDEMEGKTLLVDFKNILVVNLALTRDDFQLQENNFLNEIESHIPTKNVKCNISNAEQEALLLEVEVSLYCFYLLPHSGKSQPLIFLPIHKLERLLTSGDMRGFLQKYNITKFRGKGLKDTQGDGYSLSVTHKHWFFLSLVLGTFFSVVCVVMLYCFCCRKRKVKEGELDDVTLNKNIQQTFAISPIKQRNSFSKSPKKFAYSPQKNSTPIFSFTSPVKGHKVIYASKNPIDTTPPSLVQPQLDLLFPIGSCSDHRTSSISYRSSGNSSLERSKNLLQSRRGSSASLVIDLSPRSPVHDFISHESPTEEILLRKSRILRYRQLEYVKENDRELHEEFWSIPPNTVSRRESNIKFSLKNRYPDIIPNSKTMVRFKGEDQSNVYINANYVGGYNEVPNQYIATQGPLPCTLADFWMMVWQCDCSIIVMITKLKERSKDKCAQYWPSPETVMQEKYGEVVVTYDSEIERSGYKIITLYASHINSDETRKITHYWFTGWPDHKVPKESCQVISLVKHVRQLQSTQSGPVVIHCSAGRGRTGCFIALCLGISQIEDENKVDILKIVSRMRIDRGGMVDKDHQYIFIYKALYEYWSSKRRCSLVSPTLKRHRLTSSTPIKSPDENFNTAGEYQQAKEMIDDTLDGSVINKQKK